MPRLPKKAGYDGIRNYGPADETEPAEAPTQEDQGTAINFLAGSTWANPTAEVKPGVWGEGSTKSG